MLSERLSDVRLVAIDAVTDIADVAKDADVANTDAVATKGIVVADVIDSKLFRY